MTPSEFFEKYPSVKECFMSPDGELHFNQVDADLHARIRNLEGQSQRLDDQSSGIDPVIVSKSSKKL